MGSTSPSADFRDSFLAALAIPFLRSQSIAASISPADASNAFLQSIIGEPVFSRSSFTIAGVAFTELIDRCPVNFQIETGHTGQLGAENLRGA